MALPLGDFSPVVPRPVTGILWSLLAFGVLAFLLGASGLAPERAWQTYLVNFLFWSGLSLAGLALAAILHIVRAGWAEPLRRLAIAGAGFLPLSFALFFPLLLGRRVLFSWMREPPTRSFPMLFFRDAFGLALLYGSGLAFFHYSVLPESARSRRILGVLSPVFVILYGLVFSLIAFDFVMFLDPQWPSTLFGAFFCVGNLYLGLAVLALLAVAFRRGSGLRQRISARELHDLGKLLFGFCLLWTYLLWSQYLPIWYGNLPEETRFVLLRTTRAPWAGVSIAVLALNFAVPFVLLLSQRVKKTSLGLGSVAALVVVGMWLERYVLVVPSVWRGVTLPLGAIEVLISAGFLAAYALTCLAFARTFPL